jgi:hypothetical protein
MFLDSIENMNIDSLDMDGDSDIDIDTIISKQIDARRKIEQIKDERELLKSLQDDYTFSTLF